MLNDNQLWILRFLVARPNGFHEGLPQREGITKDEMETEIGHLIRGRLVRVFGPPNVNCCTDEGMDVDELTLLPAGRAALRQYA